MNEELKGKTVLVTGGTGSIGSEIVKQLLEYDITKVIVLSRDEIKHFLMKKRIADNRLVTVIGDVRDYRSLERVFQEYEIDLVYNTAAMKHVIVCEEIPIECVKTNILGTQNVVDLALKYKVPKLINVSTDKSAAPVNVMGASKFIAERIVLNANYTCVRFGNVANSRGSVIPVFIDNIISKKTISITDPNVTRFILEIPDAVRLVIKATKYTSGGDIFILKMKAFRLGNLLDVILDKIIPRLGISRSDLRIETIGLTCGEKIHEDLINYVEFNRVYEYNDMYLILKNIGSINNYTNIKKIDLRNYSSDTVEEISESELERIVLNHISKLGIGI
jgi:FlaA1/EpsC-like NDP-sugar epimerase